jgi:cell division protein FtsL
MQLFRPKQSMLTPDLPEHIAKAKVPWTKRERLMVLFTAGFILVLALGVVAQSNQKALSDYRNSQIQDKISQIKQDNDSIAYENRQVTNRDNLDKIARDNDMSQNNDIVTIRPK